MKFIKRVWIDVLALIVIGIIFVVPFIFIFLTAAKPRQEAALQQFTPPSQWQLLENFYEVLAFGNYRMLLALWNSMLITVGTVTLVVLFSALVAFVLQRRSDRMAAIVSSFMLAGLVLPPSVVPTIFLLQWIGLYKTLIGMILVNVALGMAFAILILRAFVASIPKEIDEAAIMDGASPLRVFFAIILPLLRPAMITVIVAGSRTARPTQRSGQWPPGAVQRWRSRRRRCRHARPQSSRRHRRSCSPAHPPPPPERTQPDRPAVAGRRDRRRHRAVSW